MAKVMLFGIARIELNIKSVDCEGTTIKEVLTNLADKTNKKYTDFKKFMIYLNEVEIHKLKGFKTEVTNDDVIMLLSPSTGG